MLLKQVAASAVTVNAEVGEGKGKISLRSEKNNKSSVKGELSFASGCPSSFVVLISE